MPHITRMHWMERRRLLGTFQVLELYNQGNGNFLALARALKNCLAARHFFWTIGSKSNWKNAFCST